MKGVNTLPIKKTRLITTNSNSAKKIVSSLEKTLLNKLLKSSNIS